MPIEEEEENTETSLSLYSTSSSKCTSSQWLSKTDRVCYEKKTYCSQYSYRTEEVCLSKEDQLDCLWNAAQRLCTAKGGSPVISQMPLSGDNKKLPDQPPPPSVVMDPSGQWGDISDADVFIYQKIDNTVDNVYQESTATPIGDLDPPEKYLVPNSWTEFFKSFKEQQLVYQNPLDVLQPSSSRASTVPFSNAPEFAPDDEPLPSIPGGDSYMFINNVQVQHNLKFTKTMQYGMAITVRAFVWNHTNNLATINLFFKPANGSTLLSSINSRYANKLGQLNSALQFRVMSAKAEIHAVLFVPYSAFPIVSTDIRMVTELSVGSRAMSTQGHVFRLRQNIPATLPAHSVLTESGRIKLSTKVDQTQPQIHAFIMNGFGQCCIPNRVKNLMSGAERDDKGARLRRVDQFPDSFNFFNWGIHTLELEWNVPSDLKNPTAYDQLVDVTMRRSLEDFIRARPNDYYIFIGHSFGADTLMKLTYCIDGKTEFCTPGNRGPVPKVKVFHFVSLDAVRAAGVRGIYDLASRTGVNPNFSFGPSSVRHLQAYWTKNPTRLKDVLAGQGGRFSPTIARIGGAVGATVDTLAKALGISTSIPINPNASGAFSSIQIPFGQVVQEEQSISRDFDGSPIKVRCEFLENCPGKTLPSCKMKGWNITCKPGSNGTKQRRMTHGDIPNDKFIQTKMMQQLCTARSFDRYPERQYFVEPPSPCNGR
jgi:hypothetical protein